MELKEALEQFQNEWKANFQAVNERFEKEVKKFGEATGETKQAMERVQQRLDELETRFDRLQKLGVVSSETGKEDEISFAKLLRGMVYGKWDGAEREQKALSTGVNEDGGYLIRPEYASGVLDLVRANTVFDKLGVTRFTDIQGSPFRINKQTSGATGYMIGEGQDIPTSQPAFGQIAMNPKKAAAMVPISNDLIRRADPVVEQIVRNDVAKSLAALLDKQMLEGNGTAPNMRGVLNTSGVNEVTLGDNGGAPTIDTLYDALYEVEKNNGQVTAWVFHPRTKQTLRKIKDANGQYILQPPVSASEPPTLLGLPYYTTTQIPIDLTVGASNDCSYILAGQWSDAVIAEWLNLQIEASREASYWTGTQYVSAFSRDETVVRAIVEVDFALRRPEMFVKVTGVRP
ncbi:hypothetical protein BSNK01_28290 [Bacillaceae bacterium]